MREKTRLKIDLLISLVFIACIYGCNNHSFDANALAKEYCDCMKKNNADNDYYNARILCDSKLALKNRYFRINYIEALYGNGYMGTLDRKTRDSVNEFSYTFTMYISDHCPYIYNADSIRKDYLKKQK